MGICAAKQAGGATSSPNDVKVAMALDMDEWIQLNTGQFKQLPREQLSQMAPQVLNAVVDAIKKLDGDADNLPPIDDTLERIQAHFAMFFNLMSENNPTCSAEQYESAMAKLGDSSSFPKTLAELKQPKQAAA